MRMPSITVRSSVKADPPCHPQRRMRGGSYSPTPGSALPPSLVPQSHDHDSGV